MDALPTLPQVLASILGVLQEEDSNPSELSNIILQDIGLTSRIIAAERSSPDRTIRFESVEQAVRSLGTSTVRIMLVTAAVEQTFEQFNPRRQSFLKMIWRRALTTASLGKALAVLTGYQRPEDAHLAGLFAEIGRLVRLTKVESEYHCLLAGMLEHTYPTEFSAPGPRHVAAGVALLEEWGMDPFLVDAVRFHLEPAHEVRDAHHLVKLTNLAYAMASSDPASDAAPEAANLFFGLDDTLTRELHRQVLDDISQLETVLEIDTLGESAGGRTGNDRFILGQRVQDLQQLEHLKQEWFQAEPQLQHSTVQKVVFLTLGVEKSLLFLIDQGGTCLRSWTADEIQPTFVLQLENARSLVADALLGRRTIRVLTRERQTLSVVDQQIFGICSAEVLWIQPLVKAEQNFGVLVLGLAHEQLPRIEKKAEFVRTLGIQIVMATIERETRTELAGTGKLEKQLREMVHEASNPLSIIQNYLGMLRIKLGEHHDAQQEISIIREEIERVGRILTRASTRPPDSGQHDVSLNDVVRQVTKLFAASMGVNRKIAIEVELCPDVPPTIQVTDHVRQILTNLLKNAAEALRSGGRILVATKDPVSVSGRRYTELTVEDNGPGLPPEIMANLFSLTGSTGGLDHRGLGLNIVKGLADEMDAILLCSSGPSGTRFQLLLPHDSV